MTNPSVSIVIPAYNEEAVIGETVTAVVRYLGTSQIAHEVLVVDDGSTDHTIDIVCELAKKHPEVRLLHGRHRGKGAAIKEGMLTAQGAYRLFMDADHATRIEEWERCARWLRDGCAVVIGSRKMPGALVARHQPPLREAMGKIFTWLTNVMLSLRLTDITCGFKCFTAEAAQAIFPLQQMDGWGFDAEILFIAHRLGYQIQEAPVAWRDDPRTKVRLLRDAWRSFMELVAVRIGGWKGRYNARRK